MYVFFRLIWVWFRARSAPRQKPTDLVVTPLLVFPNDLDLNLHMNNGRYLTIMDLGRYDMIFKSGLLGVVKEQGWFPVLSTGAIRFRRSLRAFQRFELTTQIVWWDEKWFFIEHVFKVGSEVYCRALVKALFRDSAGNVAAARMLAAAGYAGHEAPPQPAIVAGWLAVEAGFR